jgi:membrane dipeptidase
MSNETAAARSMDRRTFISLAAAGALTCGSTLSRADAVSSAQYTRWRDALIVNALGELRNTNENGVETYRTGNQRALDDARASGMAAINITVSDSPNVPGAFEEAVRAIEQWDAILGQYPRDLLKVLGASDILRARAERRIGVIYGFQNAGMLGEQAARIDTLKQRGVRIIQLTYNPANQLGDGCMAPQNHGLTPFGREAVARLNANRIMVDLSHSGEKTCIDAAKASTQPISINHTGCRALVDLPRNKTDEELRLVASRGGFVGIYFMPYLNITGHASAADVVAHVDHAIQVCGEDHVGIGTDGSTTPVDDLEAFKTDLAREVAARQAAGIAATGERTDTYPFVVDLRGPDQFYRLADLLAARGYKASVVEKVLGRNFLRYAQEVWGSEST